MYMNMYLAAVLGYILGLTALGDLGVDMHESCLQGAYDDDGLVTSVQCCEQLKLSCLFAYIYTNTLYNRLHTSWGVFFVMMGGLLN